MEIDKKAISDLAGLLRKEKLCEIEYEKGDVRIRVASEAGRVGLSTTPLTSVVTTAAAAGSGTKVATKIDANTITSPMVGVVYLSAEPHTPPFVHVGDTVAVGQTLCLIEAMKTFNPIKSHKAGKVKSVLIESGLPVEFNQPLFVVE